MKMQNVKTKRIFTPFGIALIFFLLLAGSFFAFFGRSGKFDQYFELTYSIETVKIPPIKKHKIGLVSDAHGRTNKKGALRLESELPMLELVNKMNNEFKPEFVVDGGDFIDGTRRFGEKSMRDYLAISKIFNSIQAPKYKVLGNHELRGMTRETWTRLNKYEKSYYYFDYDKLRIIVFDSTLIPGMEDSLKTEAYEKEIAWLTNLLENSKGYKKIIFTHYPFVPALRKATPPERVEEFNDLVSKYGVRAVFSGHVEVPWHEKIGGVDYFVVPGFYRSEKTGMIWNGSFSEATVGLKNSLKLYYKNENSDKYQSLVIPSDKFEEVKKEIMQKVNFLAPDVVEEDEIEEE